MLDSTKLRHRRNQPGTVGGGGDTILPLHGAPSPDGSAIAASSSISPTSTSTRNMLSASSFSSMTTPTNMLFPMFKRIKRGKGTGGKGGGSGTPTEKHHQQRSKRNKRRFSIRKAMGTCLTGVGATLVWLTLSVICLPTAWFQVDYHHQVQNAATQIYQQIHRRGRVRGGAGGANKKRIKIDTADDNKNYNGSGNRIGRDGDSDNSGRQEFGDSLSDQHVGPKIPQLEQQDQQQQMQNLPFEPQLQPDQEEDDMMEPITCPDGTTGFINDNYCDCIDDGSDETTTSACSHVLVHRPVFKCDDGETIIFASRIKDGVADCHDGTDEL